VEAQRIVERGQEWGGHRADARAEALDRNRADLLRLRLAAT